MLLLVDAGNTAVKLAAWEEDGAAALWHAPVGDGLEQGLTAALTAFRAGFGQPEACVICSVVPPAEEPIRSLCRSLLDREPLLVGLDWKSDVEISLKNPETMGLDRYVDAVAAAGLCPGEDRIVIDYGTATTYDLVLRDGRFVAGLICAGAMTCARALHQMTAKLPLAPVKKPAGILADNTWDSLVAGNYYARIGETRHIVAQLKEQAGVPDARVLSTGGLGELMARESGVIHSHHPHLMLEGLARLYRFWKGDIQI